MERDQVYCRGCGRMLKFIPLPSGKNMPVDSFPVRCVEDGQSRLLLYNEDGTSFRGRVVDKMCTEARAAYTPHWVDCPTPVERQTTPPRDRALSGNEQILAAARERETARRAKEEAERIKKKMIAEREREWTERQASLF